MNATLDSKSHRFLPIRLLLGLYDYRFIHLVVMEEDVDNMIRLYVVGLAKFFNLEGIESRMTHFQER